YVWQLKLSPMQKLVAITLADHCHDDGTEARPSQPLLAKKTGLAPRSIRRILHDLVVMGVIVLDRPASQHRANCYIILIPDGFAKVRPDTVTPLPSRPDRDDSERTETTPQGGHSVPLTIREPSLETSASDLSRKLDELFPLRKAHK